MTESNRFVVTGVSGRTGAAAASALIDAGERVRVVVRDAVKGDEWAKRGADVAVADFLDVDALSKALAGASGAYFVSPPQYGLPDLFERAETMALAIAEAVVRAGAPKLVALSSIGAGQSSGTGWIAMNRTLEQHLSVLGLPVTFVRAGYFMENWAPLADAVIETGVLPSFLAPTGRAIPMVAATDVGQVSAQALLEDWQGTRTIDLQGPTLYSPDDVAGAFARVLGKEVVATALEESTWADAVAPYEPVRILVCRGHETITEITSYDRSNRDQEEQEPEGAEAVP
jgi:uncharacterized protein YbjT (DUF2867 family)